MRTLLIFLLVFTTSFLLPSEGPAAPEKQKEEVSTNNTPDKSRLPSNEAKSAPSEQMEEHPFNASDLTKSITDQILSAHSERLEKFKQAAPWRKKWEESRQQVTVLKAKGAKLHQSFMDNLGLLNAVTSSERQYSQLMPALKRYERWASYAEAIHRRLGSIKTDLERDLAPLYTTNAELLRLFDTATSLASVFDNLQSADEEISLYQNDIMEVKNLLEGYLKTENDYLKTADTFLKQVIERQESIAKDLPERWKEYYMQKPLPWLDSQSWVYLPHQLRILVVGLDLRREMELPSNTNEWRKTLLRALIAAFFCTLALTILKRQSWIPTDTNPHVHHIFNVSIPIICIGICLLLSSVSPRGESFRLFLAVGNLFTIFGQMHLAWDLRMLSTTDVPKQPAPLLRFFPLTCVAYLLLYLPLLPIVLLLLWLTSLLIVIAWRRTWPELEIGHLTLEKNIRTFDCVVLWLCLLLTVFGLAKASVILYLICVSISLAMELCLGGADQFNYLNENQPQEGIRAIISNILVALAAPIILLITVSSVLLWIATLPGGMILMEEYLFKNVSVGSAEFNLFHILIIISAFFLTKAITVSGTRYLAELISSRKHNIDTTLITPSQTAFTYIIWIIFALFVLRILDIDLKNAAMVMTGLSVGIGMGLQSIVNNFFSGLLLIFGRMLQVGDIIEVGGVLGKVSRISVRDTLVQTFDNAFIYVPNSEFISGHLINWSRNDSTVRASVAVGVAYGTDTDLVVKTLKDIATKQENILRYPEPTVVFQNFGNSTLDFKIFFWVNKYSDQQQICTEMRLRIDKIFAEKGIEIAFPQMDITIKNSGAKKPSKHGYKKRLLVTRRIPKRPGKEEQKTEDQTKEKSHFEDTSE
ncbi:MAG: mechanosensitive ion channel [Desulfovibrio sp.]|nr:mechanosensitive ion channel [Desulfovibrio sp.]